MIICEEMKKLRGALDKMGVEWVDASEEWEKNSIFAERISATTTSVIRSLTVLALLAGIISSGKITKIFLK